MLDKTEKQQLTQIILETFKLGFIRGKGDTLFTLQDMQAALEGDDYFEDLLSNHIFDILVDDLPKFFGE